MPLTPNSTGHFPGEWDYRTQYVPRRGDVRQRKMHQWSAIIFRWIDDGTALRESPAAQTIYADTEEHVTEEARKACNLINAGVRRAPNRKSKAVI